jgi:hypothetical protein
MEASQSAHRKMRKINHPVAAVMPIMIDLCDPARHLEGRSCQYMIPHPGKRGRGRCGTTVVVPLNECLHEAFGGAPKFSAKKASVRLQARSAAALL